MKNLKPAQAFDFFSGFFLEIVIILIPHFNIFIDHSLMPHRLHGKFRHIVVYFNPYSPLHACTSTDFSL